MTDTTSPDQADQPDPSSYTLSEMAGLRRRNRAVALLPDATSPVLLDGSWWAIQQTDPTPRYQQVAIPAVADRLDAMADQLANAAAAIARLDPAGGGFLPRPGQEPR